jgi:hypothetical protein
MCCNIHVAHFWLAWLHFPDWEAVKLFDAFIVDLSVSKHSIGMLQSIPKPHQFSAL